MKFKVQAFRTAYIIETADFEVEATSEDEAVTAALVRLREGDGKGIHYELGDSVGSNEWEIEPTETAEVTT